MSSSVGGSASRDRSSIDTKRSEGGQFCTGESVGQGSMCPSPLTTPWIHPCSHAHHWNRGPVLQFPGSATTLKSTKNVKEPNRFCRSDNSESDRLHFVSTVPQVQTMTTGREQFLPISTASACSPHPRREAVIPVRGHTPSTP